MQWPNLLSVAVVAASVFLVLAAAFWWWLWWPKRQVDRSRYSDPKVRADVEDNFRKTAGQLIGGAAVLMGAGFAYLQFTQQQRSAQDLLISNQVSKGFEQLGSEKPVVQLGGIYALEGVINSSQAYHRSVLEALCAFVRDGTRTATGDGPPATPIQAALTVIGRRKIIGAERELELTGAHIPKAVLINANLGEAELNDADLRSSDLRVTNLSDAELHGADLRSANLTSADLRGAELHGADLSGAELRGVFLNGAKYTSKTKFPADFNPSEHGMTLEEKPEP